MNTAPSRPIPTSPWRGWTPVPASVMFSFANDEHDGKNEQTMFKNPVLKSPLLWGLFLVIFLHFTSEAPNSAAFQNATFFVKALTLAIVATFCMTVAIFVYWWFTKLIAEFWCGLVKLWGSLREK